MVFAFAFAVPNALANGDPASDYLYYEDIFFPYRTKIAHEQRAELRDIVAEANASGYTIKVALIGDSYDLGTAALLWPKPQLYAMFLSQELFIAAPYRGPVLIVMPNGYGLARNGKALPTQRRALDDVPAAQARSGDLASAAVRAIRRLAGLQGVVLKTSSPAKLNQGGGGMNGAVLTLIGAGIALIAIAAALELFRRLRRRDV